ncbi:hypothetical protein [Adhaeribacter aquaticus]|uniref:hypothetical protein n=1 Tax=Adhaeribacter aquaticus TaxID=299567 RepID=UPI0012F88E8C|nr:hypothetical protein [Adhaeribacter aquaticus]
MKLLFVAHGINDDFLRACDRSLETVLDVCRFITPTFMSIALIISIGRGYLSGHGLQIDFSPIVKALALFLLLFFYQDLMNILGAGIKGVTALFDGSENVGVALQKLTTPPGIAAAAQSDNIAPADVVEQGGTWYAKIYNSIANFSIMHIITQFFTSTTVMLVRQIVLFIRQFVLGFLYVIGPITICLSVIPAFSGLAGKWLQNFIAVQFWALTMNLLDLIYTNFATQDTTVGGVFGGLTDPGQSMDDIKFLLMSVSFIILYCMVPTLTSYIIGSTAVQGFMSAAVGMAAGAAGSAVGVLSPAAYGGGVSGALGRALGFGSPGGGGSGNSGGGSYSNAFSGGSTAPSMATGGAATAPVRYNGSINSTASTSGSSFSSGGSARWVNKSASKNSSVVETPKAVSETGTDNAASASLPTLGASENLGTTVRQKNIPPKPNTDDEDDLMNIFKE